MPRALSIVGPYTLKQTIGTGMFAKVKLATDQYGQQVAIKIFNKAQMAAQPAARLQFEREINALRLLQHPSIIEFHGVLETERLLYLVMQYAGSELFDAITRRGAFPENDARHLFRQIVEAVQFCHARGVVHRDLKPENICSPREKDDHYMLIDFGLCGMTPKLQSELGLTQLPSQSPTPRVASPHSQAPTAGSTPELTTTALDKTASADSDRVEDKSAPPCLSPRIESELRSAADQASSTSQMHRSACGSPHYASPELLQAEGGVPYDGITNDVWSLGVILYGVCCNALPFNCADSDKVAVLIRKISAAKFRYPKNVKLSSSLKNLINGILEVDVKKRLTIDQILAHEWMQEAASANHHPIANPHTAEAQTPVNGHNSGAAPASPAPMSLRNKLLGALHLNSHTDHSQSPVHARPVHRDSVSRCEIVDADEPETREHIHALYARAAEHQQMSTPALASVLPLTSPPSLEMERHQSSASLDTPLANSDSASSLYTPRSRFPQLDPLHLAQHSSLERSESRDPAGSNDDASPRQLVRGSMMHFDHDTLSAMRVKRIASDADQVDDAEDDPPTPSDRGRRDSAATVTSNASLDSMAGQYVAADVAGRMQKMQIDQLEASSNDKPLTANEAMLARQASQQASLSGVTIIAPNLIDDAYFQRLKSAGKAALAPNTESNSKIDSESNSSIAPVASDLSRLTAVTSTMTTNSSSSDLANGATSQLREESTNSCSGSPESLNGVQQQPNHAVPMRRTSMIDSAALQEAQRHLAINESSFFECVACNDCDGARHFIESRITENSEDGTTSLSVPLVDVRSTRTPERLNALHMSAQRGYTAMMQLLLTDGQALDINARTRNGDSALILAAGAGHLSAVQVLTKFNASIHLQNLASKSAIWVARENHHTAIAIFLTHASTQRHRRHLAQHAAAASVTHSTGVSSIVAKSLAQSGQATPANGAASTNGDAQTPTPAPAVDLAALAWLTSEFHRCVEAGDQQKVALLLPKVRLDAKGCDSWQAMHFAARKGRLEIMQMLLSHANQDDATQLQSRRHSGPASSPSAAVSPVDSTSDAASPATVVSSLVNARTKNDWTPLMLAVDQAYLSAVDLLLQHGADTTVVSRDGCTAMSLAQEGQHKEIQQLLEQHVANQAECGDKQVSLVTVL